MAKTWTVREAYEAIKANDSSAIADFGKRFPLATAALARSGQNDGLNVLFGALPDRVTMRIIEMSLKEGVTPVEDDENDEEVAEKPVEKKAKKAEKKQTAEKAEAPKKAKGGRPKKAEKPVEVEDDAEDDEVVAEDNAQDYSKMGAVDLFKLCKKRGIKVEPKQKANVYIKALEAADKADAEDDDDWSDDAEDEKPAKKSGKAAKATKKSDDDDEWDI